MEAPLSLIEVFHELIYYRIAQNFDRVKFWGILKYLTDKFLWKMSLYTCHFSPIKWKFDGFNLTVQSKTVKIPPVKILC